MFPRQKLKIWLKVCITNSSIKQLDFVSIFGIMSTNLITRRAYRGPKTLIATIFGKTP